MDDQAILISSTAVPVIVALLQVLKTALPDLPSRLWPLAAVALGVAWVSTVAVADDSFDAATILSGVVTGLAASGLYSASKTYIEQ